MYHYVLYVIKATLLFDRCFLNEHQYNILPVDGHLTWGHCAPVWFTCLLSVICRGDCLQGKFSLGK